MSWCVGVCVCLCLCVCVHTHPWGDVVAVGNFWRTGGVAGRGRHAQVHCRGGGGVCPVMRDHLHTWERQTHTCECDLSPGWGFWYGDAGLTLSLQSVHHSGPDLNISTSTGQIGRTFCRDIQCPQRMKLNDFSGRQGKPLENDWIYCSDLCYTHSCHGITLVISSLFSSDASSGWYFNPSITLVFGQILAELMLSHVYTNKLKKLELLQHHLWFTKDMDWCHITLRRWQTKVNTGLMVRNFFQSHVLYSHCVVYIVT